jgi:NTE family protein
MSQGGVLILCLFASNELIRKKLRIMNALVISGGGSKGAYAGGIAEFLIEGCGREYDLFIGTSAGSLLIPFLALGEVERLKKVFTSVTESDVFNICPFWIRKRNGVFSFGINHFNTLRMFLRGKNTFGESKNLRKLIENTFTEEDHERLLETDKDVVVTVANLSCNMLEYKSVRDYSYKEFCDWMWISANVVPFMSIVLKNGMEYADGGFGNYLPLQEALRRDAREVDAIILRPEEEMVECKLPTRNPFSLLVRTMDFMLSQIGRNDILIGNLQSRHKEVQLNCYHTPHILTDNAFIFDPEQMTVWWEEGIRYARKNSPLCVKVLNRKQGEPLTAEDQSAA